MHDRTTTAGLLKDSAIILGVLSAVFYTWGFLSEAFLMIRLGIPAEFLPERPVQYYLVMGAMVGLFFYLPFLVLPGALLLTFLDRKTNGKVSLRRLAFMKNPNGAIISYIGILIFLTALLSPISWIASRSSLGRFRVKSITLSPESKVTNKYEGMLFVAKKGSSYVFVDNPSESAATTFILAESDVREIVFVHE